MEQQYMEKQLESHHTFLLLIKLSLPSIFAQVINALYNLVDRMFIGHSELTGSLALSGIGICFPIISLVTAFAWFIGLGGAPLISISLGKKNKKEAEIIISNAMCLLIIIGITVTVIGYIFAKPLLLLFGASDQILPYALTYFKIYILGSLAVMISIGMNLFIIAQGHTLTSTLVTSVGAVLNIILDWLLIFQFHMGIKGAAIATVISQVITAVCVISLLVFSHMDIRINVRNMRLKRDIVIKIMKLGLSSFVFMANESLIGIFMNMMIRKSTGYGDVGDLYIGAMTIVTSVSQLLFLPLQGLTQGTQPIVGYCKGAGDYKRLTKTVNCAKILSVSYATLFWAVLMGFPGIVTAIFTNNSELIHTSTCTLRLAYWECFLFGFQMINQHMFVAMGNAKYSFLFAMMRKILLLIPITLIAAFLLGVKGIFFSESIATLVTAIVTQIVFTRYLKKEEAEYNK